MSRIQDSIRHPGIFVQIAAPLNRIFRVAHDKNSAPFTESLESLHLLFAQF